MQSSDTNGVLLAHIPWPQVIPMVWAYGN